MTKSILIVGDSIACLGPLMFFGDKNTDIKEIIHVSDKRDTEIKYKNIGQFNRYLGKYGTSNYWHAVSPIAQDSPKIYKRLFEYLYETRIEVDNPSNYVPLARPNSSSAVKKLSKIISSSNSIKYRFIEGTVKKVECNSKNEKNKVIFENLSEIDVDYIFFAINPLDCLSILNVDVSKAILYDHIHKCHGIYNSSIYRGTLNPKVKKTLKGYTYEYIGFEKTISYLKPFYGNPEEEIKPFNFGKTTSQIYRELLLTTDLSSKFNAISSKFGLRLPSKFYEIWSQNVVKRCFVKDTNLNMIIPTDQYEKISEYAHPDVNLISNKSNFVIPGNHFYLILEKEIFEYFLENRILFSTVNSSLDNFDGRHSSLLSAYYSYEKLLTIFL